MVNSGNQWGVDTYSNRETEGREEEGKDGKERKGERRTGKGVTERKKK